MYPLVTVLLFTSTKSTGCATIARHIISEVINSAEAPLLQKTAGLSHVLTNLRRLKGIKHPILESKNSFGMIYQFEDW